ncbi:MAG: creatininase family protein [Chloroflexi bacterium]|nr:creatininase family protein [Chloroflexota bacterium]
MRFGDLTYLEIRQQAKTGCLAILPTGCTEQQGPHLPVDFDTWLAERLCLAASRRAAGKFRVQSLVLPAIPFGPTPEHRNYGAGYVDIPGKLHSGLVSATLASLAAQGFERIVVWRGCGGHDLRETVREFNQASPHEAQAFLPEHPFHDIWCRLGDPDVPGGHADSFSTSISLHLRPATVRVNEIRDPAHRAVDWQDPDLDFARYSSTGVIGNPTHASAQLGAKLWEASVASVAKTLRAISLTSASTDGP